MIQQSREVWECNHCGHAEEKEEEVLCWKCGKGEMIYRGKFWVPAKPLPCPSRWEVYKESVEIWWKKHAGDPEDPNGFGVNILQTIFWAVVAGVILVWMI